MSQDKGASNSPNTEANSKQMKELDTYVKAMKDDGPMPYHEAQAELTAAISNMDNPPSYTKEQIDTVLGKNGMGPNAVDDYEG